MLEENGYVVLKATSYRRAQERQRIAEAQRHWAECDRDVAHSWARDCLANERHLYKRCEFLAALAISKGATMDDLFDPSAG